MEESKTFTIESGEGSQKDVLLSLHHWDKQQARLKGAMWAGPILIGGLLTIFIPIVHFVSVPASIIVAPIVYMTVTKLFSSGTSFRGEALCPACQKPSMLSGSTEAFPAYVNCMECRAALKVVPQT